jgi:HEAT repeat protein
LAAVAALGKLGGRTAGTALRKLLQSDDEVLRDAADEALDELNFGSNPLIVG